MICTKELIKKKWVKSNNISRMEHIFRDKRISLTHSKISKIIIMEQQMINIINSLYLKSLSKEVVNKMITMMMSIMMTRSITKNIINKGRRKRRKVLGKFLII